MESQSIKEPSQELSQLSRTFSSNVLTELSMSGQSLQTLERCACTECKNAMWQMLPRRHLRCYCNRMYQITFDSTDKSLMIELCDGMTLDLQIVPTADGNREEGESEALTEELMPDELLTEESSDVSSEADTGTEEKAREPEQDKESPENAEEQDFFESDEMVIE